MGDISTIDWAMALGVVLLGWFLAVYFKTKYKIPMREFVVFSFFVAGLAIILVAAYHMLRTLHIVFP